MCHLQQGCRHYVLCQREGHPHSIIPWLLRRQGKGFWLLTCLLAGCSLGRPGERARTWHRHDVPHGPELHEGPGGQHHAAWQAKHAQHTLLERHLPIPSDCLHPGGPSSWPRALPVQGGAPSFWLHFPQPQPPAVAGPPLGFTGRSQKTWLRQQVWASCSWPRVQALTQQK